MYLATRGKNLGYVRLQEGKKGVLQLSWEKFKVVSTETDVLNVIDVAQFDAIERRQLEGVACDMQRMFGSVTHLCTMHYVDRAFGERATHFPKPPDDNFSGQNSFGQRDSVIGCFGWLPHSQPQQHFYVKDWPFSNFDVWRLVQSSSNSLPIFNLVYSGVLGYFGVLPL